MIAFDYNAFIAAYPAFNDTTPYPQTLISNYWTMGTAFIDPTDYGWMTTQQRTVALQLMTAHLTALGDMIMSGNAPVIVNSTTIDKITVSLTPPPVKNQFQWWLNTTPYGMQLNTLLSMCAVGGMYIGGAPERSSFRGSYGQFN